MDAQSNILVTESKRACLADFGFSSVIDSQGLKTASLSSAAQEGGTVRFQAPELIDPQFEGSRSQASDIYAFALVCYEVTAICQVLNHLAESYSTDLYWKCPVLRHPEQFHRYAQSHTWRTAFTPAGSVILESRVERCHVEANGRLLGTHPRQSSYRIPDHRPTASSAG